MTDQTDGYVTDVGYTRGYFPELNPLWTRLALLSAGFAEETLPVLKALQVV